jgi:hypothetical protein
MDAEKFFPPYAEAFRVVDLMASIRASTVAGNSSSFNGCGFLTLSSISQGSGARLPSGDAVLPAECKMINNPIVVTRATTKALCLFAIPRRKQFLMEALLDHGCFMDSNFA